MQDERASRTGKSKTVISIAIYHVAIRPFDPVRFLFCMKLKGKTRTPSPSAPAGTGHLAS